MQKSSAFHSIRRNLPNKKTWAITGINEDKCKIPTEKNILRIQGSKLYKNRTEYVVTDGCSRCITKYMWNSSPNDIKSIKKNLRTQRMLKNIFNKRIQKYFNKDILNIIWKYYNYHSVLPLFNPRYNMYVTNKRLDTISI